MPHKHCTILWGMKKCRGCETVKPYTDYYANPNVKDGCLNWCKPCIVARYAEGRSRRQRQLLAYIHSVKMERGCADCGYKAHPAALDFDHLPGHQKLFRLASMAAGATREKIDAEMAKCDVVCANCHRIRTADRRDKRVSST